MIQLERFNLTTPEFDVDGNALTYYPGEFPDNAFFHLLNGELPELWTPTKGASTANSDRTRTEFREIIPGTRNPFNWSLGQYDQFLRAGLTLSRVTPNGKVCVGQIHGKGTTHPALKLIWDNGKIRAFYRPTWDTVGDVEATIVSGLKLGDRFTYSIHVTTTGKVSINVAYAGQTYNFTFGLGESYAGRLLYFKAGLYTQETPTDATPDDVGSSAVFDKLEIQR